LFFVTGKSLVEQHPQSVGASVWNDVADLTQQKTKRKQGWLRRSWCFSGL
jgi:hypothetical protein